MQPNNESNGTYQIANGRLATSTCRMLTRLYNDGMSYGAAVITDLANVLVNSPSTPGFLRISSQQGYDDIDGAPDQKSNPANENEDHQTRRNSTAGLR